MKIPLDKINRYEVLQRVEGRISDEVYRVNVKIINFTREEKDGRKLGEIQRGL